MGFEPNEVFLFARKEIFIIKAAVCSTRVSFQQMSGATHLRSLQALDLAIQEGSLQGAARRLGITAAAVGQRIRSLEEYLETDLLVRGRSGLQPTPALGAALDDLRAGFAALDRATDKLDFQRAAEIHVVADPDWADLWLLPRLAFFRRKHPNISFNVNGEGDVPMRLGAADCIIDRDTEGPAADGEPLFTERFLPVCSPENQARLEGAFNQPSGVPSPKYLPVGALDDRARLWRHSAAAGLEGFPLLHIQSRPSQPHTPSWREWTETFGYERVAPERGVRYAHMHDALEGVRSNAGLLICGLSFVLADVEAGRMSLPFPACEHVLATSPYRIRIRDAAMTRPQVGRFRNWLISESEITRLRLEGLAATQIVSNVG